MSLTQFGEVFEQKNFLTKIGKNRKIRPGRIGGTCPMPDFANFDKKNFFTFWSEKCHRVEPIEKLFFAIQHSSLNRAPSLSRTTNITLFAMLISRPGRRMK